MALSPVEWHVKQGGGGGGPAAFSDILVPSAGCLFASETPNTGSKGSSLAGLNIYEGFAKNDNDIVRIYKTNGWSGVPSTAERSMAIRSGHDRAIFDYTWKVSAQGDSSIRSWAQIASGVLDGRIETAAEGLAGYDRKVFLSIHHEPEDNVSGTGYSTGAFVDMFDHVIDLMVTHQGGWGATNIVPVVNFMGWRDWHDIIPDLLPDPANYKWIAYDPYIYVPGKTVYTWLNDPLPGVGWPGFYDWVTAAAPGVPLMLGEWGFSFGTGGLSQSQVAGLYDAMPAILQADFPMLKALIYWNSDVSAARNYRVQGRSIAEAAFSRLANHPYFNQVSTNLAP